MNNIAEQHFNKNVGGKGYTKLILQSNTMHNIVGGKGYNKWVLQSKPMNKLVGGSIIKKILQSNTIDKRIRIRISAGHAF